jgi:hypothetical protein
MLNRFCDVPTVAIRSIDVPSTAILFFDVPTNERRVVTMAAFAASSTPPQVLALNALAPKAR